MDSTVFPCIAVSSGIFATGAIIYRILRPRFSIKVNCWFCNQDTIVPYGNKNCWDCPSCDQYNGFAKDGNYNKPIPSQYDDSLNHPVSERNFEDPQNFPSANNLCHICNRNQVLKIKQLASYIPKSEETEEEELKEYSDHLDREYRLCDGCEKLLNNFLKRQDSILQPKVLSWNMQRKRKMLSMNSSICNVSEVKPYIWFLRWLTLISAFSIFIGYLMEMKGIGLMIKAIAPTSLEVLSHNILLYKEVIVAIGLFALIIAIFGNGKENVKLIDAINCFAWLLFFIALTSKLINKNAQQNTNTFLLLQSFSSVMCLATTVWSIFCRRSPKMYTAAWKNGSMRSNKSSPSYTSTYANSDCSLLDDNHGFSGDNGSVHSGFSSSKSKPINSLNISSLDKNFLSGQVLQDNSISTSSIATSLNANYSISVGAQKAGSSIYTELQAMKIGTPQKNGTKSGVFTLKNYMYSKNQYPQDSSSIYSQHSVLRPPIFKEKSITQSSWVAGGLWSLPSQKVGSSSAMSNYSYQRNCFNQFNNGFKSTFGYSYGNYFPNNNFGSHPNLYSSFSCPTSPAGSVFGDHDKLSAFSLPVRAPSPFWSLSREATPDQNKDISDNSSNNSTKGSFSSSSSASSSNASNMKNHHVYSPIIKQPENPEIENNSNKNLNRRFKIGLLLSIFANLIFGMFLIVHL